MIKTLAVTSSGEVIYDLPLRSLKKQEIKWFWVDFQAPTEQEINLLSRFFRFHPLAIEDCVEFVQRPKMDFYDDYYFLVLHSIHQKTLAAEEVDLFVSEQYIVSFHKSSVRDLNNLFLKVKKEPMLQTGPMQIMYQILDGLVDDYFPPVYQMEDLLNEIEENTRGQSVSFLMDQVFSIRSDLYKLRRTIIPMRDLLYRMISSPKLSKLKEKEIYLQDVYDHLLKQVEMVDANRELTADIRDSYLSISSEKMNRIMMTLTVISSIFLPLTFIAGLYGMNFVNMPELKGKYSYFIVLGVMAAIAGGMILFFRKKGYFRYSKSEKL
ncbi:magnesium/cobalt transporter CorA [Metabacillus sp. GX 13764]|uniref:magnesium/cobalt transporter CorA n=1 Tax=Metabacillus kandeliae TaxID=2900151 RepID=UPI001E43480A|nr:magnesium/cobalt transporter CorA [Metabacillus kandeliae]MCD7035446.1 magnesium/cobalt transporter CorA [Metabacillus kandeliae]